jgi:parvulin-like peptidyl-prolyl isomerase
LGALLLACPTTRAQTPTAGNGLPAGAAAVVNGQVISEVAVWRGLQSVAPERRDKARPEILNLLIDNAIVDQYVAQMKVKVEKEEIDKKLAEGREDLKKAGKDFDKMLKDLKLTEQEMRDHVAAGLRWDKFTETQVNDKALQELFAANKDMFNGSQVRARHILLTPPAGDAKAADAAAAELREMKKQIEGKVAAALAALPANTDNLERERERMKVLDKEFGALAEAKSACPTKEIGGDVNWFPRDGMVEAFAKAAFALQPYQMSDMVQTQFGYHLILVTDRKPGTDVKFEDAKEMVRELYCERLREAIVAKYRPSAKITVAPAPAK